MGLSGPILTQKNIKLSIAQQYPYRTRWVKTIVANIHIYGAREFFLLFCDIQVTKSESQEKKLVKLDQIHP